MTRTCKSFKKFYLIGLHKIYFIQGGSIPPFLYMNRVIGLFNLKVSEFVKLYEAEWKQLSTFLSTGQKSNHLP